MHDITWAKINNNNQNENWDGGTGGGRRQQPEAGRELEEETRCSPYMYPLPKMT